MKAADLRAWRARYDVTLDQLGELLGVNRQTIWRWENERHDIPRMLDLALWALEQQHFSG